MLKVCIVTGTRAEYGILTPLLEGIQKDESLELQLIVTGMHLSPEFGLTYREIEKDGFHIDEKIDMLISSDTTSGIAKSVGIAILGMTEALNRLQPDILLLLGDRYEIFAAAQTAMLLGIVIGHIHGGERTEGAVDESIRHAITKMAHLHFTATEEYRQRVIQMGEQPDRVFNVGALGIEKIRQMQLLSKSLLEKAINFSFLKRNFLITLHPETLLNEKENLGILEALLKAMDAFPDIGLIITGANADACGQKFNQRLKEYVDRQGERAVFQMSLGQLRYFSCLQCCDLVIGNSSSGIIEAPFFKIPTINIGNRQEGRMKAKSIIDCKGITEDIIDAVNNGFFLARQSWMKEVKSVYGTGNTTESIIKVVKKRSCSHLIKKKFYDVLSDF
nr:UDP-N-acetylglucosamine 2-epimerase [uncultured Anaeromusa sp.]